MLQATKVVAATEAAGRVGGAGASMRGHVPARLTASRDLEHRPARPAFDVFEPYKKGWRSPKRKF